MADTTIADDFDDGYDDYEPDPIEEAMQNCCGSYDRDGVFWCGAAGSEDCDFECPFSRDIGLTAEQAEQSDLDEMAEEIREKREAAGNAEYESWFNIDAAGHGTTQK